MWPKRMRGFWKAGGSLAKSGPTWYFWVSILLFLAAIWYFIYADRMEKKAKESEKGGAAHEHGVHGHEHAGHDHAAGRMLTQRARTAMSTRRAATKMLARSDIFSVPVINFAPAGCR